MIQRESAESVFIRVLFFSRLDSSFEEFAETFLDVGVKGHERELVLSGLGVVVDMVNLKVAVFPRRKSRARETMARLPETARVDDVGSADAANGRNVRVAEKDDIRVDSFQFGAEHVLWSRGDIQPGSQGLAGGAMGQKKARAAQLY